MKKVKLKDIASFSKGKQINGDDLVEDGKYAFLNGGINPSGKWHEYNVEGNSIAISEGGNSCGYVNYMDKPFWCGAHCYFLYDLKYDAKYIYYALKSQQDSIMQLRSGACMPNIKKNALGEFTFSIEEDSTKQALTVASLDKVSKLIALRKEQLAKLDQLVKSRFIELFGDGSYPEAPLIQLIVEGAGLSYGIIVPGDNVEDGVPMVRPSDFKNDALCLDNVYKVAPEIEAKYARTRLIGDEILVQVIGQPGQIMLSDSRCKGMNVTRNLAVVRPDCSRINRIYLKTYMQSQEAQTFMLGETKQSTLKQLPLSRLKELVVPVPPMVLQEQFAAFVEQTDKSKLAIQQSLDELELLKKSLMQEYFG